MSRLPPLAKLTKMSRCSRFASPMTKSKDVVAGTSRRACLEHNFMLKVKVKKKLQASLPPVASALDAEKIGQRTQL